jgi:hypothetical protein
LLVDVYAVGVGAAIVWAVYVLDDGHGGYPFQCGEVVGVVAIMLATFLFGPGIDNFKHGIILLLGYCQHRHCVGGLTTSVDD